MFYSSGDVERSYYSPRILPTISYTLSVPKDVPTAYIIEKIPLHNDQRIDKLVVFPEYFSDYYFAVTDDGILMTVASIHPLVGRSLRLTVKTIYSDNSTRDYDVTLAVRERSAMLRFLQPTYEARVPENLPAGTPLQGLEELEVVGGSGKARFSLYGKTSKYFSVHRSVAGIPTITLAHPLDTEAQPSHHMILQARDVDTHDVAEADIFVKVLDVNDHAPVFTQSVFYFFVPMNLSKFEKVGSVTATDNDGDHVLYRLVYPSNTFTVVPQTGEIMLIGVPEATIYEIEIEAFDKRKPTQYSKILATAHIEFRYPHDSLLRVNANQIDDVDNEIPNWIREAYGEDRSYNDNPILLSRRKRNNQVRATLEREFSEAEGSVEGKVVLQLEKKYASNDRFKIRDENPWVEVDPNGAVRVKQKWDYEELGPEKTIDFWVKITNNLGELFNNV